MSTTTASIRMLPPAVADAIAAGEVIERPASVVKELCENALDAQSSRIDVVLESGGLMRITVVDDGHGIAGDELALAVSRHATSKIETERDLTRIATLGFRGEALASIAAVSDLRIVSRTGDVDAGAMIRVRAGDVIATGSAAAPPGTCVEVLELFANTPARLRFMREARAEAGFASRLVGELALARSEVAFSCSSDGKTVLRTGGTGRSDAVRSVFGAAAAARLLEVFADGDVRVEGLISDPLVHRGTRAGLVVVLNGRRVHNRALVIAVEEAYRGLIPQGRHPYGLLIVAVDPAAVDVNVHPTKREVRFSDDRSVFSAVQRACWSALRVRSPGLGNSEAGGSPAYDSAGAPIPLTLADASSEPQPDSARGVDLSGGAATRGQEAAVTADLRALGQVHGEWMVAESPAGVVLVDPHAAHEKVIYVQLLDEWSHREATAPASQLLLLPAVVDCDAAQVSRYESSARFIESCGFAVERFGPGMLRCTAVPARAESADAAALLLDLLDSLDEDSPPAQRRDRAAALVACHSAVRFGDRLDPAQQQRLLDQLTATPGGGTCPHGRPTLLLLDGAYLRRVFRRPASA